MNLNNSCVLKTRIFCGNYEVLSVEVSVTNYSFLWLFEGGTAVVIAAMAASNEDLLENIVDEQEKLKLRLSNLQKLVSVFASSISKNKTAFPNLEEDLVKKISNASAKVISKEKLFM